jgi:hypothetical protein
MVIRVRNLDAPKGNPPTWGVILMLKISTQQRYGGFMDEHAE